MKLFVFLLPFFPCLGGELEIILSRKNTKVKINRYAPEHVIIIVKVYKTQDQNKEPYNIRIYRYTVSYILLSKDLSYNNPFNLSKLLIMLAAKYYQNS